LFLSKIQEKKGEMKVLHLVKSEPDEKTVQMIEALAAGHEVTRVDLWQSVVDYDHLLAQIFENERVISWW
jgi:hypothetical protein